MDPSKGSVPSELDFLEAFGVEPEESVPSDGFWAYTFRDQHGGVVRLSFDTHARSLQTTLLSHGRELGVVVHEDLARLWIDSETRLCATFTTETDTRLELTVSEQGVRVSWSSLSR